jgi:hypothetical protein
LRSTSGLERKAISTMGALSCCMRQRGQVSASTDNPRRRSCAQEECGQIRVEVVAALGIRSRDQPLVV